MSQCLHEADPWLCGKRKNTDGVYRLFSKGTFLMAAFIVWGCTPLHDRNNCLTCQALALILSCNPNFTPIVTYYSKEEEIASVQDLNLFTHGRLSAASDDIPPVPRGPSVSLKRSSALEVYFSWSHH